MKMGVEYSFRKMKLVITAIFIINFSVNADSNENFIFPPKFQTPGTFVSENSLYLPPESHTSIPYFPANKFTNLLFPYLPPTGTKSPVQFSSPFPIILSSTEVQHFDDDDNDRRKKTPMTSPRPNFSNNRNNRTENSQEQRIIHIRDTRQSSPMHYQQPIDRVDVRVPQQYPSEFSTPSSLNQKPMARSMIISAETHRNDNIFDQLKAGSSQSGHFVSPSGSFISSTTETAIPILRLSNEMDLDGSFSYEALGADQTHYVQHSHMENQGTEKEEQVVEGSYSYVGDNGQTYTVHYIADSNGFRASGDHLPVAPPIPEIIQRAIQYNLAEEAKKPPHLKSWQPDDQEGEYNEKNREIHEKNQRFAVSTPRLFTGRTPEVFSYDLSQRSNTQNNFETAASSQIPVKTVDFINKQQPNINTGTIAPQVTFLASQGAHVPSANTPQQTVSRMFINDKLLPSLPQLVNYEADDNNKALWRWQYGLNLNSQMNNKVNHAPEKNSISRSSGDDIVINFNEMTPEQYTKMLHNEVTSDSTPTTDNSARHFDNLPASVNLHNNDYNKINSNENIKYYQNNKIKINSPSAEITKTQEYTEDSYENHINNNSNTQYSYFPQTHQEKTSVHNPTVNSIQDVKSTMTIQQYHQLKNSNTNSPYLPETYTKQQTTLRHQESSAEVIHPHSTSETDINSNKFVTQANSYKFEETSYEPKKIIALNQYTTISPYFTNKNYVTNDDYSIMNTPSYSTHSLTDVEKGSTLLVTQTAPTTTTASSLKFIDFISLDNKDNFKPIIKATYEQKQSNSKENPYSDLSNNIFLKNILVSKEPEEMNIVKHNPEQIYKKTIAAETKSDKVSKYMNIQNKPYNDIDINKKKKIDISEIINFITMKNHFESNKLNKPKSNQNKIDNHKPRNEMHYINNNEEDHFKFENHSQSNSKENNNRTPNIYPHLGELRGNIKNYKVLKRNNNLSIYDSNPLKKDLVPPPVKLLQTQNLPPLGRAGPTTRSYLPPIYV